MSFTCPRCSMTSHHPKDEEQGYCARCHEFTGGEETIGGMRKALEDAQQIINTIINQRLDRVRVGDHIQQQASLKLWLQQWLDCYATDIFPEPDLKKAAEILKANGMTIDSLSAEMGRHILTRVIQRIDNPPETD